MCFLALSQMGFAGWIPNEDEHFDVRRNDRSVPALGLTEWAFYR